MSLSSALSFSLQGFGGNVESGGQIDIAPGMDVCDAAYLIAQRTPGGVAALAARMDVNAGTLQNKLNTNNSSHHLTLKESVSLQLAANDAAVLQAMAQQLGYTCHRAIPPQDGGDPVEAFMHVETAKADFTRAVADALHGKDTTSRNEVRRATDMANELFAAVGALMGVLAARMPKPVSEG